MKHATFLRNYMWTCLFLTINTVTHPPSLLSRNILFGNVHVISVSLAPCGTKIAFVARLDATHETSPLSLWIQDLVTLEKKALIRSLERSICHYQWSPDGSNILYIQDNHGDENWKLYGINCVTEEIICYTPFEQCQARLIETSKKDPSTVMVGLNRRRPEVHDLYSVNLVTGALVLIQENPGDISRWIFDKELTLRGALREKGDGGKELLWKKGTAHDAWKVIRTYDPDDGCEQCSIIDFSQKHNRLYLLESKHSDTMRIVSLDISTEEVSVVMENPFYDTSGAYLDPETEEIEVVIVKEEKQKWYILRPGVYERLYKTVSSQYPGNIEVINADDQCKQFIVSVVRDTLPISYYLYDDTTRQVQELYKSRPDIPQTALCTTEPLTFKSRDGLTIHGYLTLPQERSVPLPLVVSVHDGPWQRVHWGYSAVTQWLASRGYGVLTINYRGSTGYGKKFMNAGDKEWGGAMQRDLIDAVIWALEKGIADPQKIALFGASYGGYAALVGATDTPTLFCCVASLVGITNLVNFIDSIPPYWRFYRAQLHRRVGDPKTERAFLESRSPLFKAEAIQVPVFVAQGARDARVSYKDSECLIELLKKKGISTTYLLFEDEGHVFVNAHNKLVLYEKLEQFFSQSLGC